MKKNQQGYSIVELLLTIVVISVVLNLVAAFSVSMLFNYSINTARSELLADANIATDIINNDIRLSAFVDQNNRWLDENAPLAPDDEFSWQSSDNVLILATAAKDSDGNLLFADQQNYITEKNNHIYYVENRELRRRIIASPMEANTAVTTCPPDQASEACPADSVLASEVQSYAIDYIDQDGQSTTPDMARSVEVELDLSTERFNQTINVSQLTRMVFRND